MSRADDLLDDDGFRSTDTDTIPYTRSLVKSGYRVVSLYPLAMNPIDRDPLAVLYTWSLHGHHLIPLCTCRIGGSGGLWRELGTNREAASVVFRLMWTARTRMRLLC